MASMCGERVAPTTDDVRARSNHLRGLVIVVGGVLCLVPDATLIRLVDAGDLHVVFWRSLFVGLSLGAVTMCRHRARTTDAYRAIGKIGVLVGSLWGITLVLFVYSITHTAVANTLVLLATAPLFAALFTRQLIGETIHSRTWLAMPVVFGGIAVTFAGAWRLDDLTANLAALGAATVVGLNLTLIRRAEGVDMLPPISIAGFVAAGVLLPAAWPVGVTGHDLLVIGAMGLVLIPAAITLLSLGASYLPSPEVTMLMTLETVLGPLLAWVVVHEEPPPFAIAGGTIVIVTLVLHSHATHREALTTPDQPTL